MNPKGKCKLLCGPMFSGKTTQMVLEMNRYAAVRPTDKHLIITAPDDKRDVEKSLSALTSHNISLGKIAANVDIVPTYDLKSIDITKYTVIGIDEAQFQSGLFTFVKKCLLASKTIVVSGLDGTFEMKPFKNTSTTCNILDIIPMCDEVIKMKAICKIHADTTGEIVEAPYTAMKVKQETSSDKLIGGSDIYVPVCLDHYMEINNPK